MEPPGNTPEMDSKGPEWKEKLRPQVLAAIIGLGFVATASAVGGMITDNAACWVAVGAAVTKMGDIAMSLIDKDR